MPPPRRTPRHAAAAGCGRLQDRADAGHGGHDDRDIDCLGRRRRGQLLPGMAERGPAHHRKRHDARGAGHPGMDPGAGRHHAEGARRSAGSRRHERVADVEDEQQPFATGTIPGPATETNGVHGAGNSEHIPVHRRRRTIQNTSAMAPTAMVSMSKRANGTGSRPGFSFTSQLRVKLGMMRPPIREISSTTTAMPTRIPVSAAPLKCASRWKATLPPAAEDQGDHAEVIPLPAGNDLARRGGGDQEQEAASISMAASHRSRPKR